LITHRDQDTYYYRSEKIRRQRAEYARDTLQADDYGFRTLYGRPWGEFEEKLAKEEEALIKRERDSGFSGISLKTKEDIKRLQNL
jgi:hypothetical protein